MISETSSYHIPYPVDTGTVGCETCNRTCIYLPSGLQNVLGKLQAKIEDIDVPVIRQQVISFCSNLSAGLLQYDVDTDLPELYTSYEDGEFYIEWIFDYYRFGFIFTKDSTHSGWYALMDLDDGDIFRFNAPFEGTYRNAIDYTLTVISRGT